MSAEAASAAAVRKTRVDRLGGVIAAMAALGLGVGGFVVLRPNRILDGAPVGLAHALPAFDAGMVAAGAAVVAVIATLRTPPAVRLAAGGFGLVLLILALGRAPAHLVAPEDLFARVGPGAGFWLVAFAFGLLAADALTRMRFGPLGRIAALALALAGAAALVASGALDQTSIMREYASRAAAFRAEAGAHVALSLGSVAAALAVGWPLGLLCHVRKAFAAPALGVLTALQTVPSIALFGLLIAPLGWAAANVPGAAALGVAGVGAAPAFVALTLYALLPIVSSVISGLGGAPGAIVEAGRSSGMTERQLLIQVTAPLAAPALLAGLRIVLVQTIGLTTVAALIGGGGFGTFVFQGVGQTAIDLVLLGAVPTVALAFAASVVLDAAADAAGGRRR